MYIEVNLDSNKKQINENKEMSLYQYLVEAISLSDNDLRQYILNSTPNVKSPKLRRIYSIIKSSDPEGMEDIIINWFKDHGIENKDIIEDILYRFEKNDDLIEFIRYIDPENHNRKSLKDVFPNRITEGRIPDLFINLKDKNGDPIQFSDNSLKTIAQYNQAGGLKVGHYEYLLRIMSDDAVKTNIPSGHKNGDIFGENIGIELKASSKTKSQSDPRCKSHDYPSPATIILFRNVINKYLTKWSKEDEFVLRRLIDTKFDHFEEGEIFNKIGTFREFLQRISSYLEDNPGTRLQEALAEAFCTYWGVADANVMMNISNFLSDKLSYEKIQTADNDYANIIFGTLNLFLYYQVEKFNRIVIVDPNMNYINIGESKLDLNNIYNLFSSGKLKITKMPNEKSKSAYDCAACIKYVK